MKEKALLSTISGVFFAIPSYFLLAYLEIPNAFYIAIFSGLLFYILLMFFLLIYQKIMDNKYAKYEKLITSPIIYKTNGNFNIGEGSVRNGNIYICQDRIVCLSLDEKPYALDKILMQDIDHYQFDDIHLNIFTKDERVFNITLSDVKKVKKILERKDWMLY